MKLIGNGIYVQDLQKSIEFYKKILGFNLDLEFDAGEFNIAFLTKDSFRLELLSPKENKEILHSENIMLSFAVESLDSIMNILAANSINIFSGPFSPEPNIKFIFIKDPSGVLIQLAQRNF
ncbi:MAG: VOC family protein [Sarcina sp.]